jgi:hypothetical protein
MEAYCTPFITGIDANRTIKDELAAAVGRRSSRRRISVTDLVNPRQTYFSRTRPDITLSPDRIQAMMAGTGFHELFGRAVSTEEFVEQLVVFEEIAGKIDVFEDAPVELKTTRSIPADILLDRTSHVEQLAMYCIMAGRRRGHLLYYRRGEFGREPILRAFDLEVTDPDHVTRGMLRRRDLLRDALERKDPASLPRCEWAGRDCAYEACCGCDTAAPLARLVSTASVVLRENAGLTERLRQKIATPGPRGFGRRLSLNDLVFPRKAAYRLLGGGEDEGGEDAESRMASYERMGFEDTLKDAIWFGTPGASRRVVIPFGSIRASVLVFRGVPALLRTTKKREMVDRGRLAAEFPHYIERLGFECALMGSERGRLIIYYSAIPADKFMVYDIWYKGLGEITAEMRHRLDLLGAGAPPDQLPACQPEWMSKFCKFAPACGCGPAPGSSTAPPAAAR